LSINGNQGQTSRAIQGGAAEGAAQLVDYEKHSTPTGHRNQTVVKQNYDLTCIGQICSN